MSTKFDVDRAALSDPAMALTMRPDAPFPIGCGITTVRNNVGAVEIAAVIPDARNKMGESA